MPIESKDDQKFLLQAQHEFRVAQMLDHPNLIKVFALETPKDWLFRIRKVHLLLEYVNGKTLDTMPRIPMPQLVQLFERVEGDHFVILGLPLLPLLEFFRREGLLLA